MSRIIGGAAVMMSIWAGFALRPIENTIAQMVCSTALSASFAILIMVEETREDKINNKIAALEKKIDDIRKAVRSDEALQ